MLRYFNFEPSFKLRWYRARDSFGSQIPVVTLGFELRISCIRSSYLWLVNISWVVVSSITQSIKPSLLILL